MGKKAIRIGNNWASMAKTKQDKDEMRSLHKYLKIASVDRLRSHINIIFKFTLM